MPLVYAHRGGALLRPENTLAAFDHGMTCGADGLEFDVHLSKDGVVVVHHDDTLDRTTSGRGRLADYTAEQLRRIDAGFHFRDGHGGHPYRDQHIGIPTLDEVLRRYPTAQLIIELKVDGPHLARAVVDAVRRAGAVERVAVGSFYPPAMHAVREAEPALATGATKDEIRWALYKSWVGISVRRAPYREFQVPERSGFTPIVTRRFVSAAHRAGLPVKVWTVNEVPAMRRLLALGVDALITDRPDLARSVVDGHGVQVPPGR